MPEDIEYRIRTTADTSGAAVAGAALKELTASQQKLLDLKTKLIAAEREEGELTLSLAKGKGGDETEVARIAAMERADTLRKSILITERQIALEVAATAEAEEASVARKGDFVAALNAEEAAQASLNAAAMEGLAIDERAAAVSKTGRYRTTADGAGAEKTKQDIAAVTAETDKATAAASGLAAEQQKLAALRSELRTSVSEGDSGDLDAVNARLARQAELENQIAAAKQRVAVEERRALVRKSGYKPPAQVNLDDWAAQQARADAANAAANRDPADVAIEEERAVIARQRLELQAAITAQDEQGVAIIRGEIAIRSAVIGVLNTEKLTQAEINALRADGIARIDAGTAAVVARSEAEARETAEMEAQSALNKQLVDEEMARQAAAKERGIAEAAADAEANASGPAMGRGGKIGTFLKGAGIDPTMAMDIGFAALIGIQVKKSIEEATESLKKEIVEQEKFNAELDKQLEAYSKVKDVAQWDKENEKIEDQIEKLRELRETAKDNGGFWDTLMGGTDNPQATIDNQITALEGVMQRGAQLATQAIERAQKEHDVEEAFKAQKEAIAAQKDAYDELLSASEKRLETEEKLADIGKDSKILDIEEKERTGAITHAQAAKEKADAEKEAVEKKLKAQDDADARADLAGNKEVERLKANAAASADDLEAPRKAAEATATELTKAQIQAERVKDLQTQLDKAKDTLERTFASKYSLFDHGKAALQDPEVIAAIAAEHGVKAQLQAAQGARSNIPALSTASDEAGRTYKRAQDKADEDAKAARDLEREEKRKRIERGQAADERHTLAGPQADLDTKRATQAEEAGARKDTAENLAAAHDKIAALIAEKEQQEQVAKENARKIEEWQKEKDRLAAHPGPQDRVDRHGRDRGESAGAEHAEANRAAEERALQDKIDAAGGTQDHSAELAALRKQLQDIEAKQKSIEKPLLPDEQAAEDARKRTADAKAAEDTRKAGSGATASASGAASEAARAVGGDAVAESQAHQALAAVQANPQSVDLAEKLKPVLQRIIDHTTTAQAKMKADLEKAVKDLQNFVDTRIKEQRS